MMELFAPDAMDELELEWTKKARTKYARFLTGKARM